MAIEYHDFPTVEWTLAFKNEGTADTPLLSEVQAVDTRFHRGKEGEFTLHSNTGSPCTPNDYEPHAQPLGQRATQRIATCGGRSTDSNMPYFNVEWPGQGVIVVLGWPGQWAADFIRDDATGLQVRGGQELTHFKLHPGEEVRAPLAVLQFWKGDWIRSQNIWRRWMSAHNLPRPGGKPMPPAIMVCMSDGYPGMKSNAADEIRHIDRFVKAGAKPDYWWIDAGWYPCGDGWGNVGTWEPDPQRYPKGLREVADRVHAGGMKLVVWFEPERVTAGHVAGRAPSRMGAGRQERRAAEPRQPGGANVAHRARRQDDQRAGHRPVPPGFQHGAAWFLAKQRSAGPAGHHGDPSRGRTPGLLGRAPPPASRHAAWTPAPAADAATTWRRSAAPSRCCGAITVSCRPARKATPTEWRSGFPTTARAWGPSTITSSAATGVLGWESAPTRSRGKAPTGSTTAAMIAELRRVAPYFSGDYYPLTGYSLDETAWMAWQFDRPDLGEGVVQVFRRAGSYYESARFPLGGLEADARYIITDLDSGRSQEQTGANWPSRG